MAHKCKCYYCKIEFDRDKEPYVQITERRYAHKACAAKYEIQKSQQEKDYEELVAYLEKLFGLGYVNAKTAKQIKDFRENYTYTYSGILGTLIYWYEVKGASVENANGGIGIVPYVYEDAKKYYTNLANAAAANEGIKNHKTKFIEIEIAAPRPEERKPRLFNLEEEN